MPYLHTKRLLAHCLAFDTWSQIPFGNRRIYPQQSCCGHHQYPGVLASSMVPVKYFSILSVSGGRSYKSWHQSLNQGQPLLLHVWLSQASAVFPMAPTTAALSKWRSCMSVAAELLLHLRSSLPLHQMWLWAAASARCLRSWHRAQVGGCRASGPRSGTAVVLGPNPGQIPPAVLLLLLPHLGDFSLSFPALGIKPMSRRVSVLHSFSPCCGMGEQLVPFCGALLLSASATITLQKNNW